MCLRLLPEAVKEDEKIHMTQKKVSVKIHESLPPYELLSIQVRRGDDLVYSFAEKAHSKYADCNVFFVYSWGDPESDVFVGSYEIGNTKDYRLRENKKDSVFCECLWLAWRY